MTNNQLAPERISDISDYFVEMQDHYSDPADRENFEIFRDAELLMKELQERRKAAMDSEPVAWTDEQELRDVDRGGCGYLFTVNPVTPHADERRIILLYRHAQQPVVPSELHPDTQKLVIDFCTALAEKLYKAQLKYGYDVDWKQDGWTSQCQAHFHQHIAKGDPRDVAAYCAFMWYHGWHTEAAQSAPVVPDFETVLESLDYDVRCNIRESEHVYQASKATYDACRAAMLNHPSSIQPNTGAAPGAEIKHPSSNSQVIGIDPASGQDRTVEVRYVAPPGYVMVPKEPTPEMLAVINEAIKSMRGSAATYARVLAAAPQEVKGE